MMYSDRKIQKTWRYRMASSGVSGGIWPRYRVVPGYATRGCETEMILATLSPLREALDLVPELQRPPSARLKDSPGGGRAREALSRALRRSVAPSLPHFVAPSLPPARPTTPDDARRPPRIPSPRPPAVTHAGHCCDRSGCRRRESIAPAPLNTGQRRPAAAPSNPPLPMVKNLSIVSVPCLRSFSASRHSFV